MLSQGLFAVLVLLVAVQRSAELRRSQSNEARLRMLGARDGHPNARSLAAARSSAVCEPVSRRRSSSLASVLRRSSSRASSVAAVSEPRSVSPAS